METCFHKNLLVRCSWSPSRNGRCTTPHKDCRVLGNSARRQSFTDTNGKCQKQQAARALKQDRPEADRESKTEKEELEMQRKVKERGLKPKLTSEEERRVKSNLKRYFMIERTIKTLTISPGLTGTLALLTGHLLHLDPFGGLNWDQHDAFVGLLCILPLLLLDSALMLPDFHKLRYGEPKLEASTSSSSPSLSKEKHLRAQECPAGPQSSGEQSSEASFSGMNPAAAALATAMSLSNRAQRTPLMRLKGSVMYVQALLLQRSSKAGAMPLPLDLSLLVTSKLGVMMLQFGVLLDGLANWETDRLYESGMGESFLVLGRSMSLHQLGQWAALGAMTAGLLALALVASAMQENDMAKKGQLLRKELSEKTRKAMEFNIFKQGLKESSAVDASLSPAQVADQLKKSLATSKELHTAMESLVENRKKDRSAQDLWNAVLVTAREVLGLWGVGASFILTGNLLAPLAASVAAGTLRSGFTRVQAPKMRRRRAELLSKLEKSMAQKEKEIAAKKDDLSNDEGKASHDE